CFRNLVVTVAALSIISIIYAAVARSFRPLAGFLLLFPACGNSFVLDGIIFCNWQFRILEAWVKKDLDFAAFSQAVKAIPEMPEETLGAMLATLPSAGHLASEQKISSSTRQVIAAAATTIYISYRDSVVLKTAGAAIASGSVLTAIAFHTWMALIGN